MRTVVRPSSPAPAPAPVQALALALAIAAISCTTSQGVGVGEEEGEAVGQAEGVGVGVEGAGEEAGPGLELLALNDKAKPRTLVEGIKAAENQLFTSTGRLFVSGDEGIFELVRGPNADGSMQKITLHTGESCFFGGLTEQAGTIYANCYDFTNSAVFAAALSEKPQFRAIHRLPGVGLLNGLTSDGAGSLFVASTFDGRIIRLRVSPRDPLAIESQDVFDAQSGFLTNGLKYFDKKLYWTAFTDVNVASVKPNGASGPKRNLGRAFTFFDDLYVDAAGLVVADYLNGSVVECDLTVRQCTTAPNATFEGPSSVQRANGRLGLPQDALIVTERTGNRVSVLEP